MAVTAAIVMASLSGPTRAFTRGAQALRHTVKYCVASSPAGVSDTEAKQRLDEAIANWHLASGLNDAQGLTLSRVNDCANADVRIRNHPTMDCNTYAWATTDGRLIEFNNNDHCTEWDWWDGVGARASNEISFKGILAHEMGHTFGIGHAGNTQWSYDGLLPTMAECTGSDPGADSVAMETPAQDEWGGVAYVRGGALRYWNANPGFEDDFAYWGHSSGTSVGSTYANTGTRGVRMAASGDYVYITSVYDPVRSYNGMSSSPTVHVAAYYKHPSVGTTGGVRAQYDRAYLRWDQSLCKRTASATRTTWLGVTNLGTACGDPGTAWTLCDRSVSFSLDSTNDSLVFRTYVRSTSSAAVYVDRVGSYGGVTS